MFNRIIRMRNKALKRLRDKLVKHYPFPSTLTQPVEQETLINEVIRRNSEEPFVSIADIIKAADMGITKKATGIETDIDLTVAGFQFIMRAANAAASASGERIYLFVDGGNWKDMSTAKLSDWKPSLLRHGFIEVAITDKDSRLLNRFSISIWANDGNDISSTSHNAPVKRLRKNTSPTSARTDALVEPIDVVYTWVNAADPEWRNMISEYKEIEEVDLDRFAQVDELKYSIRSVLTFAPWVRNIYVFSNCAPPPWFVQSDRVKWVMHEDVIDQKYLPLFSSHSIEMFLHQIPGLSERYIYFNDDVFACAFLRPRDFFTAYGQSVSRMEQHGAVPHFERLVEDGTAQEWQSAALNSARLLHEWKDVFPTLIHRHTPHAYCKSTYTDLVNTFPDQAEVTRTARFRALTDFTFTSFLYHHFALATGRGIHISEEGPIVRATNYRAFVRKATYTKARFFCINDGGGSATDPGFQEFKRTFLESRFGFKSIAEI